MCMFPLSQWKLLGPQECMKMTRKRIIMLNRIKLWITRILIILGFCLVIFDYYLVYHNPYWNFNLMLAIFLVGLFLISFSFTGKLLRRTSFRSSKKTKNITVRTGGCSGCGACCKLPVLCVFYMNGKCRIYEKRPRQCREFPRVRTQLVSYACGYYCDGTE